MGWAEGFEPSATGTTIRRSTKLSYAHREDSFIVSDLRGSLRGGGWGGARVGPAGQRDEGGEGGVVRGGGGLEGVGVGWAEGFEVGGIFAGDGWGRWRRAVFESVEADGRLTRSGAGSGRFL